MQKSKEEITASVKSGFGAMMLMVLSVASFVVFLWILMAAVRLLIGLTV